VFEIFYITLTNLDELKQLFVHAIIIIVIVVVVVVVIIIIIIRPISCAMTAYYAVTLSENITCYRGTVEKNT